MKHAAPEEPPREGIRILLLASEGQNERKIRELLGGDDIRREDSRNGARAALDSGAFDLIISDNSLPALQALEALRLVRERDRKVRFIAILDRLNTETSIELTKLGISAMLLSSQIEAIPDLLEDLFGAGRSDPPNLLLAPHLNRYLSVGLNRTWDMVLITNARGEILWVNRAFEERTGWERAEVIGQNPRILKGKEQTPGLYENLWATLLSGKVWRGSFINRRRNGEFYPEETTITPVRNAEGGLEAFVAVKRDVSERQHLEEDLRLAHKLDALGRMAGGIAHHFNNLMTAALASTEIIQLKMGPSEEFREEIDNIREVLGKASELTKHLLSMSSHQFYSWESLELNSFVEEELQKLRKVLPENILLDFKKTTSPLIIRADREHLAQALLNIMLNARDALPSGGHVELSCDRQEPQSAQDSGAEVPEYARMIIADDGPGMDTKTLARAFDPFYTTREELGRVGLGLNIVHGIIQQHGGYLEVDSAPGRGSKFSIYLPLSEERNDEKQGLEAARISPPEADPEEATQEPEGETPEEKTLAPILVVEDEAPLRRAMVRILSSLHFESVPVSSAEIALEVVDKGLKPLLIISDVKLPMMSGPELLRALRKKENPTPFLFCSGFSREDLDREFSDLERVNFISKPFNSQELEAAIQETLRS